MPDDSFRTLINRLQSHQGVVGIMGLGYVGLPLAATFAEGGFTVIGFDIAAHKIEELRAGASYIRHIPAERLRKTVRSEAYRRGGLAGFYPSEDYGLLAECDAILICVPTPLTEHREPDLSYVIGTARAIAAHLRRSQLIVLESTTYPGTTDEVVREILEAGALRAGQDFYLASSPEREDPNNAQYDTTTIPKLIGGYTPRCGEAAAALYGAVLEKIVPVSSARVVEAAKLLENIYRSVIIATDHTVFDYPMIVDASALVIDTRNATRSVTRGREKIVRALIPNRAPAAVCAPLRSLLARAESQRNGQNDLPWPSRPNFCVGAEWPFRSGGNFSMTLFLTIRRIFEYVCAHLGCA
jgi:UDP-N-acetyl-D-mannosaminuronate dehydrogenase